MELPPELGAPRDFGRATGVLGAQPSGRGGAAIVAAPGSACDARGPGSSGCRPGRWSEPAHHSRTVWNIGTLRGESDPLRGIPGGHCPPRRSRVRLLEKDGSMAHRRAGEDSGLGPAAVGEVLRAAFHPLKVRQNGAATGAYSQAPTVRMNRCTRLTNCP